MQTQTIMVLEACSRCGQPITPGEPAMQTASVDLDEYGRAVSSPVKSYHLSRDAATKTTGRRRRPAGRPCSPHRRPARGRITRPATRRGPARSTTAWGMLPGSRSRSVPSRGARCVSVSGVRQRRKERRR